jgi:hypothetical protein
MKLTDLSRAVGLQNNMVSTLTNKSSAPFKFVFNFQLEEEYNFQSITTTHDPDLGRRLSRSERLKLYTLLCECIDTFIGKTITEVNDVFERQPDKYDTTIDPVDGTTFPIKHYAVSKNWRDKTRVHGYFNEEGYFIVKRVDWFHLFHKAKKNDQRRLT